MSNPISYMQTDPQWKNNDYSAKGESTTIGRAGCGVTCAAMVIASLKDESVTPATTAKWSLAHGYKALRSGTYYSYFVPQLKAYGIGCRQMNQINNYHHTGQATLRASVTTRLKQGYWIIACMGKGTWTSSGHYVLAYGISPGGKVLINDPASVALNRVQGNLQTFLNEAKYFWLVENIGEEPHKPKQTQEVDDLTRNEVTEIVRVEIKEAIKDLFDPQDPVSDYAQESVDKAKMLKITDGSRPRGVATREEVIAMLMRALGDEE